MPRKRTKARSRRAPQLNEFELWLAVGRFITFEDTPEQRRELADMRDSWEPHRDEIEAETARRHPGCRPAWFWHFDAPADKRHLGSTYPFTAEHFGERLRLLESMNALFEGEREALGSWIRERERGRHATRTA